MAFALLVCALVLLTVVYFVALMTGEVALWLYARLIETRRVPQPQYIQS